MSAPWMLLDASCREVATGTIGGEIAAVPAGRFALRVQAIGEPIAVDGIEINPEHLTRVELEKEGQEVGRRVLGPLTVRGGSPSGLP